MCKCDTDASTLGHCMKDIFVRDGAYGAECTYGYREG